MDDNEEIISEFLVEAVESLDRLDDDLLALERDPSDRSPLASAFRIIHTIKGTSGFLAFHRLESITHVGESLLSRLRDGDLVLTTEIATALLSLADAVRQHVASIAESMQESDADFGALVATLQRLAALDQGAGADAELAALDAAVASVEPPAPADEPEEYSSSTEAEYDDVPVPQPRSAEPAQAPANVVFFDQSPAQQLGEILVETGKASPSEVAAAIEKQLSGAQAPLGELLVSAGATAPADVSEALAVQQERRAAPVETSIRVDTSLLDTLLNLVGELVLARNQLLQYTSASEDRGFHVTTQRLNLITTELQEGVMKTRMQQIGTVWNRFPRIVRDIAVSLGKDVDVVLEGTETELDRTLLEAIRDPLTHLVRNSVDHGIESPDKREALGKPRKGTLTLRAAHEGGQVVIEIADDGGGIDVDKVRLKAGERGLERPDVLARMSEREVLELIFRPGFSTADQVTNVSGRGVGMDVVRTNVERVGGTVDVSTTRGSGTTFRVTIPLTLAIVPALVVTCGGERFAIPQVSLVELVRVDGEGPNGGIEWVDGTPVHRLRGQLLPLVDLAAELGLGTSLDGSDLDVVVLQADNQTFGVLVESVLDTEEIVVKPLGRSLGPAPTFAGATIMGDGRVALILDVLGVWQRAGIADGHEKRQLDAGATAGDDGSTERILLFRVGDTGRTAVQLSSVARLEEIAHHDVEWTNGHEVVQYRGSIMPLVRLSDLLGVASSSDPDAPLQVVVHDGDQPVGLVVDEIIDVVEDVLDVQGQRGGYLLGAAVIASRVTDVLDMEAVVEAQQTGRVAPALAGRW